MRARIYQPAKTAMQSGMGKAKTWVLEFAPMAEKELDPLMGWTSSGDTQSQVRLRFESREAAEAYAQSKGIEYDLVEHGEVKSMHVLAEYRGQGLSRLMLDHLLAEARSAGLGRLSLETGSQEMFLPARRLYERAGFTYCDPFGDYVLDPNSVFMTLTLA